MHIAFFTHYFPPEGNAPATRTYEHCVRWVQAGHQVTVITCVPNVPNGVPYDGYRNRLWPQLESIDGIRVVRVWTYLAANAGGMKRIANFVSYMNSAVWAFLFWCKRPDVVIATSPQFFCGWAGVLASWLKWRPFLLEIRDIWPESITTVGAMKEGLLTRFLERLERWMYRSATHIVAVGDGYRDKILEKVDVRERISVITNGVDVDQFAPREPSDDFLKTWRLHGKFVCSYVGTIGMAHGLDVTIRTAELLKSQGRRDIAICLVGDGAQRAKLQALAAEKQVAGLIRFTGRLPKEQMAEVLASSDCVLVHLRKCDLFESVIPSKIFETMAMGRPIVMGVKGPSRDIVMQADAGRPMEPDNAEELAAILIDWADHPERLRDQAAHAREHVARHYNRDDLASRYLELIISVAAGNAITNDHAEMTNAC